MMFYKLEGYHLKFNIKNIINIVIMLSTPP